MTKSTVKSASQKRIKKVLKDARKEKAPTEKEMEAMQKEAQKRQKKCGEAIHKALVKYNCTISNHVQPLPPQAK